MSIFLGSINKKISESDFTKNKVIKRKGYAIKLYKLKNPTYYGARFFDKDGLYMSYGSPYMEDVIWKIK